VVQQQPLLLSSGHWIALMEFVFVLAAVVLIEYSRVDVWN